jgi:hypothetical protein
MNNMTPTEILENQYRKAVDGISKSIVKSVVARIEFICRCNTNKAPIRFLISCLLAKIHNPKVDIRKPYNYIFITTDIIELEVMEYAKSLYERIGVEFAVLDCIGFIRHYLHFFYRQRNSFLNIYQEMVLAEPTSSVSQPLKEAFLALRRAAEADKR